MRFPLQVLRGINEYKDQDRAVSDTDRPAYLQELVKKEKKINDLYWSLFDRGKHKKEDEPLINHLTIQRQVLRVRIRRLQKKSKVMA